MSTTLKTFNIQLVNFATVLSERFPSNKSLRLGVTAIETLKEYNPKKNIEIFNQYAYQYKEIIINKDESALLTTDFTSTVNTDKGEAHNIMDTLRENWVSLDEDEKENMWKYLMVLVILCDKYRTE